MGVKVSFSGSTMTAFIEGDIDHHSAAGIRKAIDIAIEKEKRKRFKPIVYICSPYAGDVETNTANAKRYCRFAYRSNAIPIAPHLLYPQFLNDADPDEREDGLFMGLVLLGKCRELWVFGENISSGMQAEITKAKSRNMPVRYFTNDLKEERV